MKTIATVVLMSCFAISAYAQTPPASAVAPASPAKMDAKRDMRVEKHIRELHDKLKITASEETLWASVAKTMHDSADDLDLVLDKRNSLPSNASAIDDLNSYADVAQAHADSVKKLSMVFGPLYAAMPDDQKKLADQVFTQRGNPGKKVSKLEK